MQKKDKVNEKTGTSFTEAAADSALTLNPVIGVSFDDLMTTGIKVLKQVIVQPAVVAEHAVKLWGEWARILVNSSEIEIDSRDRRFADPSFQEGTGYRQLARGWLAWQKAVNDWVDAVNFSPNDRERARFLAGILTDAFAPTNTLIGNPSAVRKAFETRGKSLLAGLSQFVDDVANNHAMPQQVQKSAFTVGENIAVSKGAVVFRHEILELLQYTPKHKQVQARPIFIVPPQINKYYVYDLTPDKSFVEYLLAEGFQVFMVSWRNPTAEHRDWSLADYIDALIDSVNVAREICEVDSVNVVGACAGGITCAAMLGYLAALEETDKVASLTLMVNVLDSHADDSIMGLFATDAAIEMARKRSAKVGTLDGSETARVFNWMRPNDLIWNYVVSNYLHGEAPPVFDILYWNSDTTRLPARLHSDFLDVFKDNPFSKSGELTIRDKPIDLKDVPCPVYVTGGTTDHITPWQACYRSTQLFGGDATFVLSTAGHIQSLINPPGNSRRKYLTNSELPADAEDWLNGAEEHDDSWWPHWSAWLAEQSGEEVRAKTKPGSEE